MWWERKDVGEALKSPRGLWGITHAATLSTINESRKSVDPNGPEFVSSLPPVSWVSVISQPLNPRLLVCQMEVMTIPFRGFLWGWNEMTQMQQLLPWLACYYFIQQCYFFNFWRLHSPALRRSVQSFFGLEKELMDQWGTSLSHLCSPRDVSGQHLINCTT